MAGLWNIDSAILSPAQVFNSLMLTQLKNYTKIITATLITASFMIAGVVFYAFVNGNLSLNIGFPLAKANSGEIEQAQDEKAAAFTKLNETWYFTPTRLVAESIGLNAELVEVGVEDDGTLEAPEDWYKAGWYRKGTKPGEEGNIIIDGHYDTNYGTPAAFWPLKNLKVDDTVTLVDEVGRQFTYQVTDIFYIDIHDPNRIEIFEHDEGSDITLITCGGVWLNSKGTYDQRLVVKGTLLPR